jgi:hypothetical protein
MRCVGDVEIDVVDYDKIQEPVTVEIDKGATRAPTRLRRKQAPFLGFVFESAISQISIENILSPLRDEQVGVSMIVDISDAHSLPPSRVFDSCLFRDVFELKPSEVVIKKMLWLSGAFLQPSCVDEKNVREAVIVVVENCNTIAGHFYDVLLRGFRSGDVYTNEAGLGCNVSIVHYRWLLAGRKRPRRNRCAPAHHALSVREVNAGDGKKDPTPTKKRHLT